MKEMNCISCKSQDELRSNSKVALTVNNCKCNTIPEYREASDSDIPRSFSVVNSFSFSTDPTIQKLSSNLYRNTLCKDNFIPRLESNMHHLRGNAILAGPTELF